MKEYKEYYDLSDDEYLIRYFYGVLLPKIENEIKHEDENFFIKYQNINYIIEPKDNKNHFVFNFVIYKTISNSIIGLRDITRDEFNVYLRKFKLKELYDK